MLQFKIEFPDGGYIIFTSTDGGSSVKVERFDSEGGKEAETTIPKDQFLDIGRITNRSGGI